MCEGRDDVTDHRFQSGSRPVALVSRPGLPHSQVFVNFVFLAAIDRESREALASTCVYDGLLTLA